MDDKNRRLLTPIAVVAGCAALFLALVALAFFGPDRGPNPAVGFPVILVGLAVVALVGSLVWRSVARRNSDSHR